MVKDSMLNEADVGDDPPAGGGDGGGLLDFLKKKLTPEDPIQTLFNLIQQLLQQYNDGTITYEELMEQIMAAINLGGGLPEGVTQNQIDWLIWAFNNGLISAEDLLALLRQEKDIWDIIFPSTPGGPTLIPHPTSHPGDKDKGKPPIRPDYGPGSVPFGTPNPPMK